MTSAQPTPSLCMDMSKPAGRSARFPPDHPEPVEGRAVRPQPRSGQTAPVRLSDLERGKLNPTVVTLYELAEALGVSHVELVRPD